MSPELAALLGRHKALCDTARGLMQRKSADYAEPEDPLRNFRDDGLAGIVARMGDKVARLRAASKRPLEVADETIEDGVLDLINYAVLYAAMHAER